MPNIKTIADGGSDPNTPTIAEMRESQRKGSEGQGTASQTMNESLTDFNQGSAPCSKS